MPSVIRFINEYSEKAIDDTLNMEDISVQEQHKAWLQNYIIMEYCRSMYRQSNFAVSLIYRLKKYFDHVKPVNRLISAVVQINAKLYIKHINETPMGTH